MGILPNDSFETRMQILIDLMGSQEKLGEPAGISGVMIGKYAAGAEPGRDKLVAIANAAGVSVAWLAAGEGPMKTMQPSKPYYKQIHDGEVPMHGDHVAESDDMSDDGFVKIPRYKVDASAGGGTIIHSEQIVDHLAFRADWVRNTLAIPVSSLALINVKGDSMEPTLSGGDLILVDTSSNFVEDNAVYVLQLNGSLLVKRIQRKLDGSLTIKSDNLIYEPETVKSDDVDDLHVIGRVVWCGRRM